MRVSDIYLSNVVPAPQEAAPSQRESRRAGGPEAAHVDESSHVPSQELAALVEQVRVTPEFRGDILKDIAERIANGYYLSAEAAERSAEAILRSPD